MIVGSYAVLFVSLAAHAAQFAFLVFFENPRECLADNYSRIEPYHSYLDIERMYGQPKALAKRVPLVSSPAKQSSTNEATDTVQESVSSTPAATEGDTATETDLETETEIDESHIPAMGPESAFTKVNAVSKVSKHQPSLSMDSTISANGDIEDNGRRVPVVKSSRTSPRLSAIVPNGSSPKRKARSQHDLLNKYFRRDAVVLRNLDLLRQVPLSVFSSTPR